MLDFIMSNLNDILIAIASIVTGASGLAALTPASKTNGALKQTKKVLDVLALNVAHAKPAA